MEGRNYGEFLLMEGKTSEGKFYFILYFIWKGTLISITTKVSLKKGEKWNYNMTQENRNTEIKKKNERL